MQAPEHTIENARAGGQGGRRPEEAARVQKPKAPEGVVSWTEETFERLQDAPPEALVSRMRVNHAMILNVINQPARSRPRRCAR